MKKKTLLYLLLLLPFLNSFAEERDQKIHPKIGVGFGYHNSSIAGDSIRPIEISTRYRLGKHTFQLYVPLYFSKDNLNQGEKPDWMKQEHYDLYNHSFRKSLWGIGIGYDYILHSHSVLDFFAGVSLDYQSYEYREDETYMYYGLIEGVYDRSPVYEDFYKEERSYYYWDRVRGISVFPNSGIRFSTSKFCMEAKFGLYCSRMYKEAYAFGRRKLIWENDWSTGESFYPEKNRDGIFLSPDISIGFTYYL